MSGICGWNGNGGDVEPRLVERLTHLLTANPTERSTTLQNEKAAIGGSALGDELQLCSEGGLLVALLGSPTLNATPRSELTRELARRYRAHGPAMVVTLRGHFALAILDPAAGETFLACDRMGVYPLTYSIADRTMVFASRADAVCSHPAVPQEIDGQALYNYLYFHFVPGPRTIYADVKRLPAGCHLHHSPSTGVTVTPYWQPQFQDHPHTSYGKLREQFIATVDASVSAAAEGAEIGTFLSGGLDSSTVTGFAQRGRAKPIRSFSMGFAAEGYDEMAFARVAANHFGVDHREYYITPDDIVDAITLIGKHYEQPFGNSSAVPTYCCARFAREQGVERLLAGDGGDELFGGNERYAKQQIFALYDRIPPGLRAKVIEPVVFALPPNGAIMPLHKLRRYVEQASVPMPLRLESYNLLHHIGVNTVVADDFLASVDTREPHDLLERRYSAIHSRHLVNRMLALDFEFTLVNNDLPKVTRMCEAAGVEVAFPLLSDELVALSLRLPAAYKLSRTQLRPFFKRALNDFLPQRTLSKAKHGFGLPFGVWFRQHRALRAQVLESLDTLRSRGIVRETLLQQLVTEKVDKHADYYGEMIWILVMLEEWYRHHVDVRFPNEDLKPSNRSNAV